MIYICIPTHNEQQTVGVVLWKLRQVLTDYPRDYQLLVADDGSTDKTAAVLEPYTRVLPLTVIHTDKQLGTAAATEMLLREAVRRSEYPKRDVIVTLQADFSEEPDDLVALIRRMEAGADVAIGNKVSVTKPTRSRVWARKLASFFARGHKWPEGLTTPFESYRAYRLHAIKNAIEDRKGGRLLCHSGWAGQAELLRAVMPHARRVDVVDVDDRLDRMQRPRREKPFASAFAVRLMASRTEPAGLVSVEELDRLAASGSHTRERGSLVAEAAAANDRAAATARAGQRNGRDHRPSSRDRNRNAPPERGRGRRPEAAEEPRPQAGRSARPAAPAGEAPAGRGRGRNKPSAARSESTEERPAPPPRQPRPPRSQPQPQVQVAVAEAETDAEAIVPVIGETKPKRRRRRRKRGGGQGAGSQEGQQAESPELGAGETGEAGDSGDNGDSDGAELSAEAGEAGAATGEKKRRRRGGRRGGRGRRRGPKPEGSEGNAEPGGDSGIQEGGGAQGAPSEVSEQ